MARQCNGESYCLEVSVDKVCVHTYVHTMLYDAWSNSIYRRLPLSTLSLQINEGKEFNLVARVYLEPQTKVGPDGAELLMPYVLYYTHNSSE